MSLIAFEVLEGPLNSAALNAAEYLMQDPRVAVAIKALAEFAGQGGPGVCMQIELDEDGISFFIEGAPGHGDIGVSLYPHPKGDR